MPVDWREDIHTDKAKRAIREGIINGLEDVVDDILDRARRKVPYRTGNLMDSIERDPPKVSEEEVSIIFAARTGYAANVEFGTGIHSEHPQATRQRIRPRESRALAWTAPGYDRPPPGDSEAWRKLRNTKTGKTYIDSEGNTREERAATVVSSIKGQEPQPYMRPALREVSGKVGAKRMARALRKSLAKHLPDAD